MCVHRAQTWYKQESADTSDKNRIINFSLFFSELFTRIKIVSLHGFLANCQGYHVHLQGEKPIEILGSSIFSLMTTLLELKTSDTVIGACNILKVSWFYHRIDTANSQSI